MAKLAQYIIGANTLAQRSTLAGVIRYALTWWPALTRYRDDGRIKIDNNAAERALRGVALGRNYPWLTIMQATRPRALFIRGGTRIWVCIISEAFEEPEDGVAWAIARALGCRRRNRGEGAFLHRHVRLNVAVCSDGAFMPQPQRDDRKIDARLQ